ncbi:hypothetical protein PF005_g16285 [Phytophthora fragariae]|uniref:Centrosomal protein CEP104 N-terminal domain-containing protein n=1 Tax=Phytophthora fragariae TaxID=53985 RepID=A0A6A4D217_9STRA|nr:hypothetical protein PF009_g17791 [Phytophthora fragariae]KAE8997571.1 hypothetical protein PF011_g15423 [Phytophthora fragariae]KAE9131875.1 hypothetical protein PF006_g15408 [Phytophthora fragariae]KAE9198047.1 hypothetical protein PF005_g16285 [Phytophthora fragariae]KAE9214067.1 hypothetical protein PF002_g17776 [Phytophthora fragariae]
MSGGERAAAHLELVFCSSDDERFPATNLTRPGGGQLTVWESEKFCEFPQELVFRVNRGLPTRIEQVNLLSHPFKVATRVEIFTSSAPSDGIHDGKTGMRFERLGFVCFLSNDSTQVTACELQEVQLPRSCAKLTHLRLVLHSCHQTRSNLFSQVGLASVVALGPQQTTNFVLPMIPSPRKSKTMDAPSYRRRANSSYDAIASKSEKTFEVKSPRAADIYIKDTQERKTPEQIIADIQIGKQLAQYAGDDTPVQPWISLEREANRLINLFEQAVARTPLANLYRVQMDTEAYTTDNLSQRFGDLERRRKQLENKLCQQVSSSPRSAKNDLDMLVLRSPKEHDMLNKFNASHPQEKEALLWQFAESSQASTVRCDQTIPLIRKLAITDEETLEMLISALDDINPQVFAAGCAFLRSLLTSLPYFQDTSASKLDVNDGNCGLSARETRLSRGIDPQYRCVRSFKDCWINAYSRHIRDTPPSKACRA